MFETLIFFFLLPPSFGYRFPLKTVDDAVRIRSGVFFLSSSYSPEEEEVEEEGEE